LILYDDGLEKEQVIRDALRRIKIMIEYQSIYGKSMSPCIFEVGISLMDCFEHD